MSGELWMQTAYRIGDVYIYLAETHGYRFEANERP